MNALFIALYLEKCFFFLAGGEKIEFFLRDEMIAYLEIIIPQ